MKLYYSPASPFVRKVAVLLHELGKRDAVTFETIQTSALAPNSALVASNPLGRIPALERPEGSTLYDSRVICQYLDAQFEGGLYPTGSRRWETLTLEATGDGIMDSAVSMAYEVRLRPEDKRFDDWIEAQWSKVDRALGVLDARWMSHLAGPLDMGQISVGCALGYLDFRHGARNWRDGHEALARWYETFESRPSMQESRPPEA
ncbi:MAG: glutathione S-transferase [Sulfitobacter sp.]|nr:glutathione S-transferase [Sulfitobacter sp.]